MKPAEIFRHPFDGPKTVYLTATAIGLATVNVATDYTYAQFHGTGFYGSESSLFSTFWLLFAISLPWFVWRVAKTRARRWLPLLVLAAAVLHLLAYPALVWALSALFYPQVFGYGQTFRYALTMYPVYAALIYGAVAVYVTVTRSNGDGAVPAVGFPSRIQVTGRRNSQVLLDVEGIIAVTASPPYVDIRHRSGNYLLTGTLTGMAQRLDPARFVRIHKSHMVNIEFVASVHSRRNGDYDIGLSDGSILRLSRVYAKTFKAALAASQRLAIE
ncbi:hypothetical protein FLLO111716_13720 [Flavobacterium longum]|uniref:LytTR family DNA-binding domain-containing protein n=1 Tax=Flavobacterium longum TaxID=1299340 RepID=UPI0039EA5BD0